MRSHLLLCIASLCCTVAALKFPQMGNQMMVPRRERGNSPIPFGSERRRALDGVARRKNMQERRKETAELEERGLWDWITDDVFGVSWNSYVSGYPSFGEGCPSVKAPFIRSPTGISPAEATYLGSRKAATISNFQKWLNQLAIPGMPSPSSSNFPRVAIAFSGGGLRAMINGGGVFDGLDSRSTSASPLLSSGKPTVNGLLNFATYMTGLSGGSWLVSASAQNNFATIDWLRTNIWKTPQLLPDLSDLGFSYANMASAFARRVSAFPDLTSLVDIWGWLIGYGLISRGLSPAKTLITDILSKSNYLNAGMPFPIIVMDQAQGGSLYDAQNVNVPILEASPIEFGDWNQTRGFVNTQMMGTVFSDANSVSKCMQNFALTQWIAGASAAVFPGALPQIDAAQDSIRQWIKNLYSSIWGQIAIGVISGVFPPTQSIIRDIDSANLGAAYQDLSNRGLLTANVYNPFDYFVNGKFSFGVPADPNGPILRLNDGGMDFQNIPVAPLLYRDVDIIVAVDNSGDTPSNWPNGTALYTSMQWAQARNIPFPIVPSPTQLVQSGNNTKPRFFGCNSNTGPLIVYLPAAAVINGANGVVNIGTVSFSVEANAVPVMIANGQANALRPAGTPGANDVPSNWAQCVGCAVMARQLARASVPLPSVCRTCFNQLCYS